MKRASADAAGAFSWIAVVFLGGLVGGAAINFLLPFSLLPGIWVRLAGAVFLVIGVGLFAWARVAFRRHRTALMPWSPSAALVRDGPFSFSRNPVYLSFLVFYFGASLAFDTGYILVMLVVVFVLFDRKQIPREERYLRQRFGDDYADYMSKVRRWI